MSDRTEKKRYGWAPKFLGEPYFETAPMRRGGSETRDRMVKYSPGSLRAYRAWTSSDRNFRFPLRGRMVINGRETYYRDDPYGRYQPPRLRAMLVLNLPRS